MLDPKTDPESSRAQLAPARALLTPTWLVALALLVANDHWLKGAGLVPEVLTGKLSDFAGLIVAPVLLASLLRVQTRRGLALSHAAVALVFAGIQLSTGFAAQWSALMGLFGHPWVITCDPTDLIALPMLAVSWIVLVPDMDPSKPALLPIQRSAVAALSVFGLWSTVATSEGGGIDWSDEWYVDVYGHAYVNNANDVEVTLYIRELRPELHIDCEQVSVDPGRLLTEDAFGPAEHWLLPARTNVGVEFDNGAACGAALIAGEGIPATIIFMDRNQYAPQWYPGQTFEEELLSGAGIGVLFGDDGGEWIGNQMIMFTPKTTAPELPEECVASPAESRLDWTPTTARNVELVTITAGADGCFELGTQNVQMVAGEAQLAGDVVPFYLCAPELALPFAPGDRVSLGEHLNSGPQRQLTLSLLDHDTLAQAHDDAGVPLLRAYYQRGNYTGQILENEIERTVAAIPAFACPWQVEDGCATVERIAGIAVEGAGFLEPGVPVEIDEPQTLTRRTVVLAYARDRAVLDQSCSDGAAELAQDIDVVIIERPLP